MKVTIGIPCYNQGKYLAQALESLFIQSHTDFEVIVVNDGSPDNTKEVAESFNLKAFVRYFESKFKFNYKIINQVNKGLASARNSAIMAMSDDSDYFLPLDADDFLAFNAIQRIVEVAEETNADVIAPSIHCFGVGTQTTILMPNPTLEDFKVGNRISYCSAIRRDALLEVGGYSPRMQEGFEDLHLWINLLTRGKRIVTIPEVLMFYRVKENSMITEANKHKDKLMAQIYKDFPAFV